MISSVGFYHVRAHILDVNVCSVSVILGSKQVCDAWKCNFKKIISDCKPKHCATLNTTLSVLNAC